MASHTSAEAGPGLVPAATVAISYGFFRTNGVSSAEAEAEAGGSAETTGSLADAGGLLADAGGSLAEASGLSGEAGGSLAEAGGSLAEAGVLEGEFWGDSSSPESYEERLKIGRFFFPFFSATFFCLLVAEIEGKK